MARSRNKTPSQDEMSTALVEARISADILVDKAEQILSILHEDCNTDRDMYESIELAAFVDRAAELVEEIELMVSDPNYEVEEDGEL